MMWLYIFRFCWKVKRLSREKDRRSFSAPPYVWRAIFLCPLKTDAVSSATGTHLFPLGIDMNLLPCGAMKTVYGWSLESLTKCYFILHDLLLNFLNVTEMWDPLVHSITFSLCLYFHIALEQLVFPSLLFQNFSCCSVQSHWSLWVCYSSFIWCHSAIGQT